MGGTGYKLAGNVVRNNRTGVMQLAGGSRLNALSENLIHGNGQEISRCGPLNGANTVPDSGVCLDKEWLASRINLGLNGFAGPISNDEGGACPDRLPDCTAPQNHPVLSGSTWQAAGFLVRGTLSSRPNAKFSIEIFASHGDGIDGLGEGEVFVGKVDVTSDATGLAAFSLPAGTDPLKDGTKNVYFTATATRAANGQTSEFSRPQRVARP